MAEKSERKLRMRLSRLMKQKEFEERYMQNPQLLTPLAFEIDKIKTELVKRGFQIRSVY